ncbi:GxxExxY protein [Candidatus Falkowbacteria bacterium]|nr:GxxExxY protein [Candidatus Falkowbacteria bacterium]
MTSGALDISGIPARYKIIGVLFDVFNKIGPGHQEKYYQKAIAQIFDLLEIPYKIEVKIKIDLGGGKYILYFADFIVAEKIIIEIKKGERFLKNNIDQLYSYLKATNLKLGILANFTRNGVQFKRIVNIRN